MTNILRFIFRLDYPPCFDVIDKPGTALRILKDCAEDNYWEIVGVSRDRNGVTVSKDEQLSVGHVLNYAINFEVNNINGTFKTEVGVELDRLLDNKFLKVASDAVAQLMKEFKFHRVDRIGFRTFASGGIAQDDNKHTVAFQQRALARKMNEEIGRLASLEDLALVLEGGLAGQTRFRIVTGPGAKQDRDRLLGERVLSKYEPQAFSVDLDIFEREIDFRNSSLYRWVKAKYPSIVEFCALADRSSKP